MQKLRVFTAEIAQLLDDQVDFLLIVRSKEADPRTGKKTSVIATNVGKPEMNDMMVVGTSTYIMDQLMAKRAERGN